MVPYLIMILLYIVLAALMALDNSLVNLNILGGLQGTVWLRIHLITLGVITQAMFGGLPIFWSRVAGLKKSKTRWDIWLTLNAGILLLLVGIPPMSAVPIILGGTLVFIASILFMMQLTSMKVTGKGLGMGRPFYLAGLGYFLLGVILGTGIFVGWSPYLFVKAAVETHIHANNWGLMSLLFAGILIDVFPSIAGRQLADKKTIKTILYLMTFGAFGLIFGPWFGLVWLMVVGLIPHMIATIWLLILVAKPIFKDKSLQTVGVMHLISSYAWILLPVFMAPAVLLDIGLPSEAIEANAPQALIYGWLLLFGMAIIPYFIRRGRSSAETVLLGGSKLSLVLVHIGAILLWASIFISPLALTIRGLAYLAWAVAMIPFVAEIWDLVKTSPSLE